MRASDGSLELDQRMSFVVLVIRVCFAVCTKVRIVAHSALVANAPDVRLSGLIIAQRSIAEDAVVNAAGCWGHLEVLVHGNETVAGVNQVLVLEALPAVVPIWAVQALVAHAKDGLSTCQLILLYTFQRAD